MAVAAVGLAVVKFVSQWIDRWQEIERDKTGEADVKVELTGEDNKISNETLKSLAKYQGESGGYRPGTKGVDRGKAGDWGLYEVTEPYDELPSDLNDTQADPHPSDFYDEDLEQTAPGAEDDPDLKG